MTSQNTSTETKAEYALRVLADSLAYFTPAPAPVRDGAAPKRAEPNLPHAA